MNLRPVALSISLIIAVIIMSSFVSRSALGLVVRACEVNSVLTGSPYPCLKIVQAQDPLSSYAVLREPTEKERTILAPLADVPGIEDPRLLTAGAPNYFDAAWRERSAAIGLRTSKVSPQDFALAINAASWRTQDRFHIHMGCETPRFRALLKTHTAEIGSGRFTKLRTNAGWWATFHTADDLSNLNPLKLVADGVEGARSNMKNVVVGVFGATLPDGQHGFYILARIIGANKSLGSAEDMIDPKCQVPLLRNGTG
ncbi:MULTISPECIES: CDP-diacylglycerol diphosphatase [unclassified Rhizobium]|uniref:CDP-diacylglycerol diphosphatase n=1 Tax=unclassified Rhizobium TaxID=2613769 RepID=UPI000CDF3E56|nr:MULTISPECIES: CDP-diacylglycerol diphosphatase [Rhizobium]AVA22094.1 CDP-diacylglycerol pyrophosphatase protein [Rhizobium sp. NXC24]UWU23146.1 CDP-diacylglycerol diphosphatase [Rhizobium tropici]